MRRAVHSLGFVFSLLVFSTTPVLGQALHDLIHQEVALTAAPGASLNSLGDGAVVRTTASAAAYDGLIVQGIVRGGSADALRGWVRFLDGTAAPAWRPLTLVPSATDGFFMGGYRGDAVYKGAAFELRFDVPAGTTLDLQGAGTFNTAFDDRQAPGPAAPPPQATPADGIVDPPPYASREAWNASPFRGTPVALARPDYRHLTFHHAAGYSADTYEAGLAQVKNIQVLHQDVRGWSDIGYHFVIDRAGNIYQGRPFLDPAADLAAEPALAMGAHVGGANTGNIGICFLGCYHPPEGSNCREEPTTESLDALVQLMGFLSERYGVAPSLIRGHRDFSSTACPGNTNYAQLPTIRESVDTLVRIGNQPFGRATLTATVEDDGVVELAWTFFDVEDIVLYRLVRVTGDDAETVLFEGATLRPESFLDLGAGVEASYRLYAQNSEGREQVIATAAARLDLPAQSLLSEAFPNPFSQSTAIRYFLRDDARVRVSVYDVTGREVLALADAFLPGEQWYTHTVDASTLSSGVYFYRLQVEGFSDLALDETKTLILVR